jgi:quercetin dioxygenase-like cupin family protein
MSKPDDIGEAADHETVFARIAEGIRPVPLTEELRDRLRARVKAGPDHGLVDGLATVRGDDGEWVAVNPLVQRKVLRVDADEGTQTLLLRAAPGALLPRHRHSRDEEFIVLEGRCRIGDLLLEAGDATFAAAGSWHDDITTDTGVLVLVRGEYPAPAFA